MTGDPDPDFGPRYRRLLTLAGAVLFWERLWPRLWPLVAVIGGFAAVALLDVLPGLAGWLHALTLVLFAAAACASAVYAGRDLRTPDHVSCRRRIERDSGLAHRPLGAGEDRLAAGRSDPAAQQLWMLHRRRMAAAASRLTVAPPSPGVPGLEPWGIRAGIVLLLVIGLAAAGGSAGERLQRAISPTLTPGAAQSLLVEIWITPPPYTGEAPIFLSRAGSRTAADRAGEAVAVTVPQGSAVLAQVSGADDAPVLMVGEASHPFVPLADAAGGGQSSAYRVETSIDHGNGLGVLLGTRTLAAWPLQVVADGAPAVAFAGPPGAVDNGRLAIAYTAADDYAIGAIVAEVRRGEPVDDPVADDVLRLELPIPAGADGAISAQATEDLAAHRWAGEPVRIRLEARDALGQSGHSDEATTLLPERAFSHPVAQAIVAERKRLRAIAPPAAVRAEVAARLDALARRPEAFGDDIVTALALSIARSRLLAEAGANGNESVRDLLWAAALRLDEGDVPRAERVLSEARAKLMEAIETDADEAEIDRLADALEQALSQYLEAVVAELARRGGMIEAPLPADSMLGSDELRDLVEMAREMARTGARDGARALLSQLQAMLDGIRNGLDFSGNREDLAEAGAIMKELRELTGAQQRLLDDTFVKLREQNSAPVDIRPGKDAGGEAGATRNDAEARAAAQRHLRGRLDEMMGRLQAFIGETPPSLPAADAAMGGAVRALGADRLGEATDRQGEAVQALRDSLRGAGQAMARQLGAGMALFAVGGRGGGDPFGRLPADRGRGLGTGEVEIPEGGELRRAGEILEELRRRAGERQRPEAELHYIERLLRRF